MKTLGLLILIILFLSTCKSLENPKGDFLAHAPTTEIEVLILNTSIKVDFSLDNNLKEAITSETTELKISSIKTRDELVTYYQTLTPTFQPGYSSLSDDNSYVFALVEYLLAQESFQDNCSSQTRREILVTAIEKQRCKYGVPYTSPSLTRRTGTFLIAVILLKEQDDTFLHSLKDNAEIQKTLLCLNGNLWMDNEEFNSLLIQYAEGFINKE